MTDIDFTLEIASWDEKPYREFDDGRKYTRADVVLKGAEEAGPGDRFTAGTFEALMYYRADGTSEYVTLTELSGTLDGRTGTFVARGRGGFDGKSASGESQIVEGSGTGELAGISGRLVSVSTHEDFPNMPLTLTYQLD